MAVRQQEWPLKRVWTEHLLRKEASKRSATPHDNDGDDAGLLWLAVCWRHRI